MAKATIQLTDEEMSEQSGTAAVSPSFANHLLAPPPTIIYHYTTQVGPLGIIENKELWATKILYMNDASEFSSVFSISKSILQTSLETIPDPSQQTIIQLMLTHANAVQDVNVCVVCFCKKRNLLSQWRGYSSSSYGYFIGFDTNELARLAKKIIFSC